MNCNEIGEVQADDRRVSRISNNTLERKTV